MCTHVCVCTSFSAKESLLLCSFSQALFLVHPQELHLPCPLKLPGVLWPQPELWDAALTLNNNVQVLCHCVGSLRCQFNKINGCLREKCEGGAIQKRSGKYMSINTTWKTCELSFLLLHGNTAKKKFRKPG